MADFSGQTLDLRDGFADHFVAFAGLLVGGDGGFGGFFGVARDFLHGGGHFVHGGGDLIGLDLLAVDPGAGLLGHGRQFFGGAGDLGDAVADAADQFAQAWVMLCMRALQLAEFVATRETRLWVRSPAATRSATSRVWFSGMMIWRVIAQAASRPKATASKVAMISMFLAWAASVSRTTVCDSVSFLLTSMQDVALRRHARGGLGVVDLRVAELATAAR